MESRGFALFAVIVLLAMMTAAVAYTLDEAVSSIRSAGGVRASEMIKSGLDHGLNLAMLRLQESDVSRIVADGDRFDIFETATPAGNDFIAPMSFPPDGPLAGQFQVRFGLKPGQRTRAPAGEDVKQAYGQIVEVQIGVEAVGTGMPPAEERVTVGVLIPRMAAHAN